MNEEFDPDKFIEDNKHLLNEPENDFDPDRFITENAHLLPQEDNKTLLDKASDILGPKIRGAAQGLTFGLADEVTGGLESLLTNKTYEQARNESRENYKKSQESDPWGYGLGELGGAIFSPINKIALPIMALQRVEQAKKYANLLKLAQASSSGAIHGGIAGLGYGDDKGDIGTGAGISAAISAIAPATGMAIKSETGQSLIKNATKYGGKVLQLPELAIDYLSVGIGKLINSIPGIEPLKEAIPGILKNNNTSNYKSSLAQSYKDIIEGVSNYKNIKQQLGDIAEKPFSDLSEQERAKVYEMMQQSLAGRSRNAYKPSVDSLQKSILNEIGKNPEYGNTLAGDMVVGKVKEDIHQGAERLSNAFRVNSDPETADQHVLKLREMILNTLDDVDKGIRDRNFNLINDGKNVYNKKAQFGDILIDIAELDKIKQSEFNPLNKIDQQKIDSAKSNLNNLMTGKKILSLGGLGAEGVSRALSTGNMAGFIPAATMVAGGIGRSVEKYGKNLRPEQIADSFIANPSILREISKRGGKIGTLAGDALKSMQDSGIEGAKSKLFLLAIDPDFRRMFNVDKANSGPEDQVRSKPWEHDDTP